MNEITTLPRPNSLCSGPDARGRFVADLLVPPVFDYPGIGPEHAWPCEIGRVAHASAGDEGAR